MGVKITDDNNPYGNPNGTNGPDPAVARDELITLWNNPPVVRPTGSEMGVDAQKVLEAIQNDREFRTTYYACLQAGPDERNLGALPPGTFSPCAQKTLDAHPGKIK